MLASVNSRQRTTGSPTFARARAILATLLVAVTVLGAAAAQTAGEAPEVASLGSAAEAFLGTGYAAVDAAELEGALADDLPPTDSAFLLSGSLSPLAKALLALESRDGTLERARHHVTVSVIQVGPSPAGVPVPVLLVQADRYNLGPAMRDELVAELGEEHVAPVAEFGEGPHVSWRFVMQRVMGQEAAIVAAARTELDDAQAAAAACLGMPCLLTSGGIEGIAPWHELEPIDLAGELEGLAYQAVRDGLASPAALLDLAAAQAHFDPYASEVTGSDLVVAEFVIEAGLAQSPVVELAFRQGHLLDDSLAAIWQRLVALPAAAGAPELYAAPAYECRRGDGGFAAPGEFCL